MTPIRYCSLTTELIYRMNCLEQEFCVHRVSVEVNGTFTFLLLKDSTTQSTDSFEHKMTNLLVSLYHLVGDATPLSFLIVGIAIPLFFRSWTQKHPMSFQKLHGVIPDFFGIRNTILIILSRYNVVEH